MMSRRNSSLILGLGLVALLVGASLWLPNPMRGPKESFPVRDLARVVPREASAWIVIDGREGERGYQESAIKDLLDQPSMRDFLAPYFTGLDQALKEEDEWIQQYAGLRLSEVLGLLRYRTTIAYCGQIDSSIPEERKVPNLLLTLEFDEDLALVRRLLFALEKAVLAWGSGTFHDEEILGIAAKRYDPLSMKGIQAWYFVEGRMLVLGTDLPTVEGVVGRLRGGSDKGALYYHPSFQDLLSGLSPKESMFWAYAVVGGMRKALEQWELGEALQVFADMPVAPDSAFGWRMRWVGSGVRDTLVVTAGSDVSTSSGGAAASSRHLVRREGAINQIYQEPISGTLASIHAPHHAIPSFRAWWTYARAMLDPAQRLWVEGKRKHLGTVLDSRRADFTLQVHPREGSSIPLVDLRAELPSAEAARSLTRRGTQYAIVGESLAEGATAYEVKAPNGQAAASLGACRSGPYLHIAPSVDDAQALRELLLGAGEQPPRANAEGLVLSIDLAAVLKLFMELPAPIRRALWPRRNGIGPNWKFKPGPGAWDHQGLRISGELKGGRRMRLDLHSPAGLVGCAGLALGVAKGWKRLSPWLRLLGGR